MIKPDAKKQSTKQYPNCGNENLLLLRSLNQKICTVCDTKIPWFLECRQKAIT